MGLLDNNATAICHKQNSRAHPSHTDKVKLRESMLRHCLLLLGLSALATAHDHHGLYRTLHDLDSENAYQALMLAATEPGSHECRATCSLTDGNGVIVSDATDGRSCFGVFKVFCKVDIKGQTAVVGTKCEGHFAGFEAMAEGKRIAVCEGALKHFMVTDAPPPPHPETPVDGRPDGPSLTFVSVKGCLGTEFAMMRPHPDSNWEDGVEHGAALMAVLPKLTEGNRTVLFQSRCEGGALSLKLVHPSHPHSPPQAVADMSDADVEGIVDEEVDKAQHPSFIPDWLNPMNWFHGPPSRPSPADWHHAHDEQRKEPRDLFKGPGHLVDAPPGHHMHPHCSLTCNGRPTLFGAAFPCMGVLTLSCGGEDGHAGTEQSPHRALLGRDAALLPSEDSAASASHEGDEGDEGCFLARCKGLFTGRWFGSKCYGLSYMTAARKEMEVVGTCTHEQVLRPFHHGPAFGMAVFCKGQSMLAVLKEE